MRKELSTVRAGRAEYLKTLLSLIGDSLDFDDSPLDLDKKALFVHLGKKPALEDVIAELKATYGS